MTPTCQYLEGIEHHMKLYCDRPATARYEWPDGKAQYVCPRHDGKPARAYAEAQGIERQELVAA